jgi:hypothetical protein
MTALVTFTDLAAELDLNNPDAPDAAALAAGVELVGFEAEMDDALGAALARMQHSQQAMLCIPGHRYLSEDSLRRTQANANAKT